MTIDTPTLVLRLLLACAIGGVLGFDRSREGHAAGLRTYVLVSGGAALFTILLAYGFRGFVGRQGIQVDPSRAASQVVVGVGFLGGGAIVARHGEPRGLTTAAGIWFVAATGIACGIGMYVVAVAAGVIALVVLAPLRIVEDRYVVRRRSTVTVRLQRRAGQLDAIVQAVHEAGLQLHALRVDHADDLDVVEFDLDHGPRFHATALIGRLEALDGVRQVSVRAV